MSRRSIHLAALLVGTFTASIVAGQTGQRPSPVVPTGAPTLDLELSPTFDPAGHADGIDIAYTLDASRRTTHGAPLSLRWDTLSPTPGRSTDLVRDLVVRDGRGAIAVTRSIVPVGHDTMYVGDRAPEGRVTVRYHVAVADPSAPNGRGPHRELEAAGGGIATSGDGILLLPSGAGQIDIRIRWRLPPNALGVSSFGLGDVTTTRTLPDILNGFYLAGPLRRFPPIPPKYGFSAYGLGSNDIDMAALFAWSARDFEATRNAFAGSPNATFRAFYRSYDGGPLDSGRADANGILLYIAPTHVEHDAVQGLKRLMAHEMIHVFQPKLEDDDDNLWFSEGSADYLALRIPFDAGLMTIEEYLANINDAATSYYGNARRNIPNDRIGDEFWKSADSWTVPYRRGAMYFADLDARVRARSAGKTILIDLMQELSERIRRKEHYGAAQWREIVVKHAGIEGGRAFDAMLSGETILPVAHAFGSCVVAEPTKIGVFDLLYTKAPRSNVIASVSIGSNAERAGLRVGDRTKGSVLMTPILNDAARLIQLPVERDGRAMTIGYLPRRGSVDAQRWKQAPGRLCTHLAQRNH